MIIESLELENYRNYDSLSLKLGSRTNIFFGDNAQGKTNILEAVYVGSTTKSHKKSRDKEIIKFGKNESHIRLLLKKNEIDYKIDMHIRKNKRKTVAVNGIPIKKASELLGIAKLIFFSPEDLNIIKNGPSERRRFIDIELCQLSKNYLNSLINYNKCLEQRNKLMKDIAIGNYGKSEGSTALEVWESELIRYGLEIISEREEFIKRLNPIINKINKSITEKDEELELNYEPSVNAENYEEKLKKTRNQDMRYFTTSAGPHHDDMSFLLDGIDLRKYGSQGQQRTASLSLKLSEIEIVKNLVNDDPILLLDDVLSELDSHRQNCLLAHLGKVQTLITCTGLDDFIKNRIEIDRVFNVKNGIVDLK
ncbi:MAG: DNA replication/repair protein RecF [Lachnospiraceae bacterium]|nr:DNA replication/repair protein RecF [Lachnospiraceae bacterium]